DTPMHALGWKALAVSVSDIAAMGGVPTYAFVSVGLPPSTRLEESDDLYKGLHEMADSVGVSVVGGDTVACGRVVVNVTLMGEVQQERLALRSGARPGDVLVVTGTLGNAGLGLRTLEGDISNVRVERAVQALLMPQPRLWEAGAAVAVGGVHAMIDLSDGLSGDLGHICKMSQVGAVVWADAIPIDDEVRRAFEDSGQDAVSAALSCGEDYELLMAVAPDRVDEVAKAVANCGRVEATVIGEITVGTGQFVRGRNGAIQPLVPRSWDHFSAQA
ncbi:MAG: thiamine-phosphate kinase, partial [Armatimonadota bacterium]